MKELETFPCSFVSVGVTHFLSAEKQMAATDPALDGQSIKGKVAYLEFGLRMPIHDSKIY
jgi:hypothetical protein